MSELKVKKKKKQYRVYSVASVLSKGKYLIGKAEIVEDTEEITPETILKITLTNKEVVEDFAGNVKFG